MAEKSTETSKMATTIKFKGRIRKDEKVLMENDKIVTLKLVHQFAYRLLFAVVRYNYHVVFYF